MNLCNIASNKGESSLKRAEKTVIVTGCKKINGCWMRIGSPDFIQKQPLGEYSVNPKQELFNLYDAKKNSMWVLWNSILELLRPQEETGQGFAQWGYGYLLGSGTQFKSLQILQQAL
jgi:hypothetical protein